MLVHADMKFWKLTFMAVWIKLMFSLHTLDDIDMFLEPASVSVTIVSFTETFMNLDF